MKNSLKFQIFIFFFLILNFWLRDASTQEIKNKQNYDLKFIEEIANQQINDLMNYEMNEFMNNEMNEFMDFGMNEFRDYGMGLFNPMSLVSGIFNSFDILGNVFNEKLANDSKFVQSDVDIREDNNTRECLVTINTNDLSEQGSIRVTVDPNNIIEVAYKNIQNFEISSPNLRGEVKNFLDFLSPGDNFENDENTEGGNNKGSSSSDSGNHSNDINPDVLSHSTMTVTGISVKQHQLPKICNTNSESIKATVDVDNSSILIKFPMKEEEVVGTIEDETKTDEQDEVLNKNTNNSPFTYSYWKDLIWDSQEKNPKSQQPKREIPVVSFEEF